MKLKLLIDKEQLKKIKVPVILILFYPIFYFSLPFILMGIANYLRPTCPPPPVPTSFPCNYGRGLLGIFIANLYLAVCVVLLIFNLTKVVKMKKDIQ